MLAVACVLLAQLPFQRDLVETKDGAVILMPPRYVAGPWIQDWKWSVDGRYIAAVVLEGGEEMARVLSTLEAPRYTANSTSVVVYDMKTRSATTVFESTKAKVSFLDWMPGSALFLRTLSASPMQSIHRWTPGSAQAQEVLSADTSKRPLDLQISQRHPYGLAYVGILSVYGRSWLLRPTGAVRELDLPPGPVRIGSSGHIFVGSDVASTSVKRIALDGSISEVPGWPEPSDSADAPAGLSAKEVSVTAASDSIKVQHSQAWLRDFRSKSAITALIAAEAEDVRLAPGNDQIGYLTQHNLFVRQLKQLTRAEYEAVRDRAEQERLMKQAQEVATALQVFASDNKDSLPSKADFVDAVSPFLRNASSLQGFSYELNGGSLSDIKTPSSTVLGYVQGRKGRAVAFVDGSVRWVPNQ